MAKTTRNEPTHKSKRRQQMEESWEQQVEQFRTQRKAAAQPKAPVPAVNADPAPRQVEALKAEAEALINGQVASKAAPSPTAYSRQDPLPGQGESGQGLLWWSGGNIDDFIPLAEYGTRQRQTDLRTFALLAPMVLIAESVLIKKMQALQWSVEAGRNRAIHWQRVLAGLGQNQGWDTFIARWTRAYCDSDYGGYAEIIRRAPAWAVREVSSVGDGYGGISTGSELTPRGEAALQSGQDRGWPIDDAKVMDPCQCVPTADPNFPLIYYNSFTGTKHRLRPYQFMRILDMPGVDDSKPNQGLCAVSRAVWASQEDRMTTRYGFEALSANPGTGMVLANVNQNLLESALASAKGARDARGVVYYKGLIFLPILDPSGNTKLEYLTFSHLPENFNRTEDYSRIKEIVAAAFGMDVLELGSIPGHNLGTSAQAEVGAAKARGKGIGALIQSTEREFRFKFLPADVQLRIKKHDVEEQKDRAELDAVYFANATSMMQVGGWDPVLANQYLADMGAIESEFPYMAADLTPSEELEDTEATEKGMLEAERVRVDQDGVVHYKAHSFVKYTRKQVRQKAVDMSVPEAIEVDDVSRARALVRKHLPEYAGMVGPASIYAPQQRAIQEERVGFLQTMQKAFEAAVQARREKPQVIQIPSQPPPTVHVHMPERDLVMKAAEQPPPVVNVTVEPTELPAMTFKMDGSSMPAPIYRVDIPPSPDVNLTVQPSEAPDVNVYVEQPKASDVTVQMDAPQMPIQIEAQLHAPDEVIETETIVERDPSSKRISRTNKRSQRK